jgi:hypothetical protein
VKKEPCVRGDERFSFPSVIVSMAAGPARTRESWLNTLPDHPIFSSPPDFEPSKTTGKRQTLAIVRSTELIVAVGSELRLAHLGEVKSGTGSTNYKVGCVAISFFSRNGWEI